MGKLTLTIMQGESGIGKSTVAGRLSEETGADIRSADTLVGLYTPRPDGSVQFNIGLLGHAHGECFRGAIESLQAGRSVIVDNTNTTVEEIAPYILLAQAFGTSVTLLRVKGDPTKALARNTHGVPEGAHAGQVARLAAFVPPFHWQFVPVTYLTVEN
jgi:predicted kinase